MLETMRPEARTIVETFAAMTKDMPIKISSITKLEWDGSNNRHWEMDFLSYVGFLPNVVEYVSGMKMMLDEDYKQDFAEIINCIMHWTIYRELLRTL